jgi:hypothetical protein
MTSAFIKKFNVPSPQVVLMAVLSPNEIATRLKPRASAPWDNAPHVFIV